jgi:hypothetical protein
MAQIQDIPRLVSEFFDLAKTYLLQETVEPAKKLGHFAGFSVGATILWSAALVLLSVAGLRSLYDLLPDGAYWEGLSYVVATIVLGLFIALVIKLVPERGVHDGTPDLSGSLDGGDA